MGERAHLLIRLGGMLFASTDLERKNQMEKSTKVKLFIAAAFVSLVLLVLLGGFLFLWLGRNYVPVSLADMVKHYTSAVADFDRFDYLEQNTAEVDIGYGLTIRTAQAKDILNGETCYVDFLGRKSKLGHYYKLPETNCDGGHRYYELDTESGKTDYTGIFLVKLEGKSMLIQVVSTESFDDNQNGPIYEHEQSGLHYQYFYLEKLPPDYELFSKSRTITVKTIHEWMEVTRQIKAARGWW